MRGLAAAALVGAAGRCNGPTVWVLAIASGCSFFDLGRRDREERDRWEPSAQPIGAPAAASAFEIEPYGVAMQLAFLVVLAVGAWDNRMSEAAWHHPGLRGVAGFLVIMAGVAIRRGAAHALGPHFTVGLTLLPDHELVTTGPYRWLRHPNYAGLLLIGFGTALMVRSPSAVGVMLVVWLPLALMRIAMEERVLLARLGSAYEDYTRGRWCLVPGVY